MHRNAAVFQHVAVVRHFQGGSGKLLHQQHGHTARLEVADDAENLFHQDGRQAHGGLVEQHDLGVEHDRAGHGQHLLLATRQGASELVAAFFKAGEQFHGAFQIALHVALGAAAGQARKGAQDQVVGDGHGGKHAPAFGRVRQAQLGDGVRLHAVGARAVQGDLACGGRDHAGDGAHGGGFASAIGADQRDHFALGHFHGNAMQDLHFAVTGF